MLRHSVHNSSSRITHPIFNFQWCLFFHYRYLYIPMFILLLYIRLLLHRCFSIIENFRPLSLLSRGYFDVTFSFHSIAWKELQRYSGDTHILNAKLELSKRRSVKNFLSFSALARVHTLRRPHYAVQMWKRVVFLKTHQVFFVHATPRFEKQQSAAFCICHSVIRRRRGYFYLTRVTLTVTKTDILRGPRSLKTKHDKQ